MKSPDEIISDISVAVIDPLHAEQMVAAFESDGRERWGAYEAARMCQSESAVGVLYNSAFIRAAARRGHVFYLGADGCVHKQSLSDVKDSRLCSDVTQTSNFYEPKWFDTLKSFIDNGASVLLIGPPGSGKTLACEQLFKARSQPLQIVSCTPSMTADDLEGRVELREHNGITVTNFEPSVLATSSEQGHAVLLDEADAIPAKASFSLFRLLDGREMRIQRMGEDGVIPRSADFRIVGTQNTEGRGDDMGLHHGRAYQDEAFLDRWDNTIRVDYFPPEVEQDILIDASGIDAVAAHKVVTGAGLLRNALSEGSVMVCCSLRRTIAIAKNIAHGFSPADAWRYALLNRTTREDQKLIVGEILSRVYGTSWGR